MKVLKEINPHFREYLFDWESKIYLLIGGYGSSKSYHTAMKVVIKLLQERRTCLVVREVFDTIRDSCYALLGDVIYSLELEGVAELTHSPMQVKFANGSKIIFRGLDKPEKLKSIHDVSLIWIEECSEIKYAGFKELLGRLRHPTLKLHIMMTTNPVAKSNWVYKHFFEIKNIDDKLLYKERILRGEEVYYHHSVAEDNLFIPAEYLEQLKEMREYDPDLYRVAWLGQFGVNGTPVLRQFEVWSEKAVQAAIEEIPSAYKFVGLDLGFEKSYNACVRVAVDAAQKYLYIYWEWYENHLTDDQTAEKLSEFKRTQEVIRVDSAEPKAIRYFQRQGLNAVAAKKWSGGTKHARLDNIRKIKRFKKIVCSDACVNCINELSDLTYKCDKDGNIIADEFNIDAHTMSAIWYALDSYDVGDLKHNFTKADFGL